jgi:hypothetical protein
VYPLYPLYLSKTRALPLLSRSEQRRQTCEVLFRDTREVELVRAVMRGLYDGCQRRVMRQMFGTQKRLPRL